MKKFLSLAMVVILMSTLLIGVTAVENTIKLDAVFIASETDTTEIGALPDSNEIAVKIDAVNNNSEESVVLYWAGYSVDQKIVSMKVDKITLPANTTKIISLAIVDKAQKYKFFVWGSATEPYVDGLTIERQKVSEWSEWYDYDFSEIAEAGEAPAVTVTGASIKIPNKADATDIRFKTTVRLPVAKKVEIVEQGVAVVPFYMIGERNFTVDTQNVSKMANDGSQNISLGKYSYEFITLLSGMPVYNYRVPVCIKGYVTYSLNGVNKTVYSDIVIYDVYSVAEEIMSSNKENEATKIAVRTYVQDKYATYIKSANTGNKISISSPASGEIVYPYEDYAKKYLMDGEKLKKGQYASVVSYGPHGKDDATKAITVTWNCQCQNVDTFLVVYATRQDFSDAKAAYASGNANSVNLYNLYKASDYYVKVIANLKNGESYGVSSTFKTADLGPRTIHLDGAYNVRDMGGYATSSGKRTVQGILYRSGQMDGTYSNINTELTVYGKYTAQRELRIKTDLDFRAAGTSPIPGAKHMFVGLSGYDLVNTVNQEKIKDTFKILSNKNNYPLVFHCVGGADRTGTIAYLLNALLGVSERDLIRDYEWTSYSIYSTRSIGSATYIAKPEYKFFATIDAQKGKTLEAKVENYLLSIGVTADEIANIKSIMLTE